MENFRKPSLRHKAVKIDPWWKIHFKDQPFGSAGKIGSVIGGLFLLAFFWQLGFMPELDLAGAASILMAVALVGVVLAVALTSVGFGAGLMLRDLDGSILERRPALILMALPGPVCVLALALYFYLRPDGIVPEWAYALPFAILVGLSILYAYLNPETKKGLHFTKNLQWFKTKRGIGFASFGYFWVLTAFLAFLSYFAIFPRDGGIDRFLFGLVLWTLWCYASNLVVALATSVNVMAILSASVGIGLSFLLSLTGNGAGFTRAIVRSLGLGEIQVALVVTSDGCDLLNKAAGGRAVCLVEPGEKTAVVCPAVIRSRIGSPLLVEVSPYDKDGSWPMTHPPERLSAIAMPKAEVPTWTKIAPMTKKLYSTTHIGATVTYLDSDDKGAWLREQCGSIPVYAPKKR